MFHTYCRVVLRQRCRLLMRKAPGWEATLFRQLLPSVHVLEQCNGNMRYFTSLGWRDAQRREIWLPTVPRSFHWVGLMEHLQETKICFCPLKMKWFGNKQDTFIHQTNPFIERNKYDSCNMSLKSIHSSLRCVRCLLACHPISSMGFKKLAQI